MFQTFLLESRRISWTKPLGLVRDLKEIKGYWSKRLMESPAPLLSHPQAPHRVAPGSSRAHDSVCPLGIQTPAVSASLVPPGGDAQQVQPRMGPSTSPQRPSPGDGAQSQGPPGWDVALPVILMDADSN